MATIWESLRRWLQRLLQIDSLQANIGLIGEDLAPLIRQSGLALSMIEELSTELAKVREEAATRQRVMRDELMESEARMMTLIEELQTCAAEPESDTLTSEPNKSGHTRWTERKRARAAAEANLPALAKRMTTNGNLSGNVRGRDSRPSDGQTQVSGEGEK